MLQKSCNKRPLPWLELLSPSINRCFGKRRSGQLVMARLFDAYLDALREARPADGLCLAVVEKTRLFTDQTSASPEAPSSFERIARTADEARFNQVDAALPLWETHVLPGKLSGVTLRRSLKIVE